MAAKKVDEIAAPEAGDVTGVHRRRKPPPRLLKRPYLRSLPDDDGIETVVVSDVVQPQRAGSRTWTLKRLSWDVN